MEEKRVSKRINGKVVKVYEVDGKFYRTKKEAGLARKRHSERSDKKCVSHNNVITVALRLCEETEIPLITILESVYASTGDAAVLKQMQLVAATKLALYRCIFVSGCGASARMYREVTTTAKQLAFKFLMEFYPDELYRISNKSEKRFRVGRVQRENKYLGDIDGYDEMKDKAGYAKYCAAGKPPFTQLSGGKVYTETERRQLRAQFGVTRWV